jgi:hypothetical protein
VTQDGFTTVQDNSYTAGFKIKAHDGVTIDTVVNDV